MELGSGAHLAGVAWRETSQIASGMDTYNTSCLTTRAGTGLMYNDSIVWRADAEDPGIRTASGYDMTPFQKRGGQNLYVPWSLRWPDHTGQLEALYSRVADAMWRLGKTAELVPLLPGTRPGPRAGSAVGAPYYLYTGRRPGTARDKCIFHAGIRRRSPRCSACPDVLGGKWNGNR